MGWFGGLVAQLEEGVALFCFAVMGVFVVRAVTP